MYNSSSSSSSTPVLSSYHLPSSGPTIQSQQKYSLHCSSYSSPPPQLLYKLNSASSDSSPPSSETLPSAPTCGGGIPSTELLRCSRVPAARNYSRQNWNSTVGPPSCRHFHTVGNDDISDVKTFHSCQLEYN